MVRALRERYSKPNLVLTVATSYLSKLLGEMPQDEGRMMRRARKAFLDTFYLPQVRRGNFAETVRLSSSGNTLQLEHIRRAPDELGADSAPPALASASDFAAALHETELNNLYRRDLGGQKVTDLALMKLVKNLRGEVPPEFRLGTHLARWAFTFDDDRPIRFLLREGTLDVSLRIRALQIGDRESSLPLEVRAVYVVSPEPTRLGEVRIGSRSPGAPLEPETARFLLRKFSALFPPVFQFDGLLLPAEGKSYQAMKDLELRQATTQNGWLVLAWMLPTPRP
jgi:hypothetical protein